MNPQVGLPQGTGPGGMVQNPFQQFVQQMQAQRPNAPGATPPAPTGTPPSVPGGQPVSALQQAGAQAPGIQGAGLPGVQAPTQEVQDAAIPGQNPGISKNLLGAASQLHQAITTMTDPREIQMIRSILIMLGQLIQRDQQTQDSRTGQGQVVGPGTPQLNGGPGGGGAGAAPGGIGAQGQPRPIPSPTQPPQIPGTPPGGGPTPPPAGGVRGF